MPVKTTATNLLLAISEVGIVSDDDIVEMISDIDAYSISEDDQKLLLEIPSAILKYRPEMTSVLESLAEHVE